MEVEFNNGVYRYYNVGEEVYKCFMESKSKGSYFHKFIKGTFSAVKVTDEMLIDETPKDLNLINYPGEKMISVSELRNMGKFWNEKFTSKQEKDMCCRESVRAFIKMFFGGI